MKQTNNAIKFLMAQYRAIFQNAYFKGLATAAVVTMGLAAGQAQAAVPDLNSLAGSAPVNLDGSGTKVTIEGSGDSPWNAAVTVNAKGTDANHEIKAKSAALNLTGTTGSLTVKTGKVAEGISLEAADGAALTVKINQIDVQSGLLNIAGAAGTTASAATVEANTISVKGKDAKISLTAATGAKAATLGRAAADGTNASTISLSDSGIISFNGTDAATQAVLQGKLVSTGGILDVATTKFGTISTFGTAEKLDINVGNSGSATISLADDIKKTTDKEDTLNITSGTITLSASVNDATLTVDKGTLNLGNSVVLQGAGTGDGKAKVTVGGTGAGELSLSKEALTKFLGATTGVASAKQGVLDITQSGTVLFTDDTVKLDGLTFAGSATAGSISAADKGKLGGKNVVVDAALTGANNLTVFAKDTLTLGKSGFDSANTDLVAKFETKNLNLVTDENSFTLRNAVTLKAMGDGKDADGNAINVAQDGTIVGKAINVSGGSITVGAGNYTFGEDVTLTSGKLEVTSAEEVKAGGDKVASSLKLANGNISIANAAGNGITVSGSQAQLDISEAGALSVTKAKTEADIQILLENKGALSLKGEQVLSFINPDASLSLSKKSSIALKSAAKLHVVDDLTLDQNQLSSAAVTTTASTTGNAVIFDNTAAAGTLVVDGKLTVNKAQTAVAIGENGAVEAGTLVLNSQPPASQKEVSLGAGTYTVLAGLESAQSIKTSDEHSVLKLGKIVPVEGSDPEYATSVGGGNITAALDNSSGSVNILAGSWTAAKTVTVGANSTAFAIGSAGGEVDAEGNKITANLTVSDKLTVAKASGLTVNSVGNLTANAVDVTGSVAVNGNMVLKGKFNDNNTASNTTDDKFGVKLAAGAIVLNDDSKLTIQGDAIKAIQTDASGNVTFIKDFADNVTNGAITSQAGSSVYLDFAEGKLSADGLKALNDKLFGATGPNGLVYLGKAEIVGLTPDANNEVSWSGAAEKYEDYLPTYTNEALMGAKLTNVESNDQVTGHFGSVVTDKITQAGADVQFTKKAGLYNATTIKGDNSGKKYFALGSGGVVLGAKVLANSELTLANGGIIDHVTLAADASLVVDGKNGETKLLKNLAGEKSSSVELKSGLTTVEGKVSTDFLDSKAGSKLVVAKDLTLTGTTTAAEANKIAGDIEVKGKTKLAAETYFAGNNTFTGDVTATDFVEFAKGVTNFAGNAEFTNELDIVDGAHVTVEGILKSAKDKAISVGEYSQADKLNSSGFLAAKYVNLNSGALLLDPAYGQKSSVAEIGAFTDKTTPLDTDISLINGNVLVGQNSALLVGSDLASARSYLASLQDQNGSLSNAEGKIGSVLYINAQQSLKSGEKIIVDSAANLDTAFDKNGDLITKYTENKAFSGTSSSQAADLYLGGNAALVLGDGANKTDGAIKFASNNAAVYAEKGAKIVLDGSSFLNGSREVTVFTDSDSGKNANTGVKILGDKTNSIRVETVNGLMQFYLEAGKEVSKGTLKLDTDKVDSAFTAASAPMRDFLLGYTTLTKNWEEMYPRNGAPVAPGVKEEVLLGVAGPAQSNFDIDQATGKITGFSATASESLKKEDFNNYVAVATGKDEHGKPTYDIYKKAYNDFLEKVVRNTNGAAADQAARMGDFGGAAETALVATSTTYDAVAGRFGMGQQAGTMTIANNGQGSGLWVTPVYKSHESDGFDADGLGYGSDITLYGVALGGDVTLANGVRVGAMFNVGSGDADGQGAASVVSNDFDYFGGSIYAGYAIDNFSIVGDVSYTTIDSDVEANTAAGKTSTSFDTTALSVGVTGQYALKVAEMDVTPHAGMRFTRIDIDDYTIDSADFGEVGQYNASSANVFSIPVGVTISKEYVSDTWTVKPSFDLTLTGNFGDDTVDGTVSWTGVSNYDVSTKAEFVDNFTYGAAVGIAAKTGNFGLGLGLNYTGSSNTDEFGVNANARYMF